MAKIETKHLWTVSEFAREIKQTKHTARYRVLKEIGCKKVKINGGYLAHYVPKKDLK